jgi:hypothetical protein
VERHFLMSYRAAARPWIRMSILVALSTVLGFAIIDHWLLVGPRLARPDVWRFGLQLPLVLIMLGLTGARLYPRWYQPAIQLAGPLFGVGSVLLAIDATPATLPLVAARLLLATFFFYFMLGLSFKAALRTNLLLIGAYAVAALLGKIAPTVAAYSLFVLFCANLIGGAGCYALEYANRVAFLERRRLAEVAAHDGLTGLLNRAALEEQARSLWQHAASTRTTMRCCSPTSRCIPPRSAVATPGGTTTKRTRTAAPGMLPPSLAPTDCCATRSERARASIPHPGQQLPASKRCARGPAPLRSRA